MATQLAPGFLVAAPALLDPNFRRSVVLLVDHGPKGSLGFVINRPLDVTLDTMLERVGLTVDADAVADPSRLAVLSGGPVNTQTGWVLFESDPGSTASLFGGDPATLEKEVVRVTDRLAVSASRELLTSLVTRKGDERTLLVLGYATWDGGQLDAEIAQGAWIPVDFDHRIVFDVPYAERWSSALRNLGIDPARLSVQVASEN